MENFWKKELRRRKYLREEQFLYLVYMNLIILNRLNDYAMKSLLGVFDIFKIGDFVVVSCNDSLQNQC
jgi:hypothetical protein